VELWRDGILGDVPVVGGEGVPRETEWANPQAGAHINLASNAVSGLSDARESGSAHQNGLRTERQGCLQVTGSNDRIGLSGFSLSGVYRAPMGTTSLEASCSRSVASSNSSNWGGTDHARAGEHVPAQANAIAVLDLTPLLLESFVIHCAG